MNSKSRCKVCNGSMSCDPHDPLIQCCVHCQYRRPERQECTGCGALFQAHHHKHETKDGVFHTSCYKDRRPRPAPEKDSNVVREFMADGIKIGMDLGEGKDWTVFPDKPNSVDKIVGWKKELSIAVDDYEKSTSPANYERIVEVVISHGKAEREDERKVTEQVAKAWEDEMKIEKEISFTKGIEAAREVIKSWTDEENDVVETLVNRLNSLKETNTK